MAIQLKNEEVDFLLDKMEALVEADVLDERELNVLGRVVGSIEEQARELGPENPNAESPVQQATGDSGQAERGLNPDTGDIGQESPVNQADGESDEEENDDLQLDKDMPESEELGRKLEDTIKNL